MEIKLRCRLVNSVQFIALLGHIIVKCQQYILEQLCNREETCDVTLPWWQYFWTTTKPTTTAMARTAKANMSILTNNNFARASRYFVQFFAVVAPQYDMKLPIFKSPLYGVGEHNTKIVAFVFFTKVTIDTVPKKSSSGFAKVNEIE